MAQLVERVTAELKASMKARDKDRTGALRMVRAAFIEAAKEGKGEVDDDRATSILRRLKKQRVEAAETYEAAGRSDLAEKETAEAALIESFLPKLADEAQTRAWVEEAVAASGATSMKEMGKAMGALMRAHKAEIDGGLARKILGDVLGGS